jgi:quercetin dioxygenase-like cupin family protein
MDETTDPHTEPDTGPDRSEPAAAPDPALPSAEAGGEVLPVDLRDWVDFARAGAQQVTVFTTDQLQQTLWCLEPQQSTVVLRYAVADVTYTVLGGRAWFVTEQGEAGLDPLASLLVPPGVTHGIDNRGADPLIVLAVSTPPDVDVAPDAPLTRLARAVRPNDTTGPVGRRLRDFLAGRR